MTNITKIDFKKELKHLYHASARDLSIIDVPSMNFLMVDGQGDPNTSKSFEEAVGALFSLSYTLKFVIKKSEKAVDYGVMPLEGLFWADDMSVFSMGRKDEWKWTLMIMQPEFITRDLVDQAAEQIKKKKNADLSRIRFEAFSEGKSAQIMHIGPFSEEGPTIEKVHTFIKDQGYVLSGRHHEIYLSDIRRAAPEKWKTLVRQPFDRL
jgi:hypothetical protein